MKNLAAIAWDVLPLIAFYAANHFFGFVYAIAVTMVVAALQMATYALKRQRPPRLLVFSTAMSLVFGAIDLWFQGPVLFRYEAAITSLLSAVFFGLSLRGDTSVIQEAAERQRGKALPPEAAVYFRLCTMTWVAYLVLKAAVYAWIGTRYDLEKALALRLIIGNASMYLMIGATIVLAKPAIRYLKARQTASLASTTAS